MEITKNMITLDDLKGKDSFYGQVRLSYKPVIGAGCRPTLVDAKDVFRIMKNILYPDDIEYREKCFVILLNSDKAMIGFYKAGEGNEKCVHVDTRYIMQAAILGNASEIILVHNHPSGNVYPSSEDDRLTESVAQAAALFRIPMADHIVMCDDSYFSYKENKKI